MLGRACQGTVLFLHRPVGPVLGFPRCQTLLLPLAPSLRVCSPQGMPRS